MKLLYFFIAFLFLLNIVPENSAQRFKLPPGKGRGIGANVKPKDHFKDMNSRKVTKEVVRDAGKGNNFSVWLK